MIDVRNLSASGDGSSLDTQAIQNALDACTSAGGRDVYFPAGRYLTGTLVVGSNTTLHISSGATLLGSTRVMPVCLAMGEAAGCAAGIAADQQLPDVHSVDVFILRTRLRQQGTYLPDVEETLPMKGR